MLKILILLALVICNSILCTCANDDEFAEFDDFNPSDVGPSSKPVEQSETKLPGQAESVGNNVKINFKTGEPDGKVEEETEATGEQKPTKKPDLKLVNAPLPRIYRWETYYIEIAFLLASLLYFANYFVGSNKNHAISHQWYEKARELLKQQFVLIGGAPHLGDGPKKSNSEDDADAGAGQAKKQRGLLKATESMYTLWCSGRVGMDGLLIEINLLKRQDLFSMALTLLKQTKDKLTLRFLLNNEGYENFVFCLAHKAYATKLARDMVDINTFCPKRKPISQYGSDVDKFFIMSELSDVVPFILDSSTVSFIKKYERSIKYIHITDQFSTIRSEDLSSAQKLANSKRMATFCFDLPMNSADRTEFILFALSLLDRLRKFKLARDSKQKSDKNRQKINDIIEKTAFNQRQEAAQAKKEELRRLEKERIYSEDDPEKQKRWEKKEAKRELKKNKMRVKQLKVKSM